MNYLNQKINEARGAFLIDSFPGNLFELITKNENYIDEYKLVIFKEDINKLSGFISYINDFTYICINYKRPIGHQNLTLGHEIGHMFLHRTIDFYDNHENIFGSDSYEKAAYDFGSELIYPNYYFENDFSYIKSNDLLNYEKLDELAIYIDKLCHKYYLSFDVILRKILFKCYVKNDRIKKIKNDINKKLGKRYTELDKNFHVSDGSTYSVRSLQPYRHLKDLIDKAVDKKLYSKATGESILFTFDVLENG